MRKIAVVVAIQRTEKCASTYHTLHPIPNRCGTFARLSLSTRMPLFNLPSSRPLGGTRRIGATRRAYATRGNNFDRTRWGGRGDHRPEWFKRITCVARHNLASVLPPPSPSHSDKTAVETAWRHGVSNSLWPFIRSFIRSGVTGRGGGGGRTAPGDSIQGADTLRKSKYFLAVEFTRTPDKWFTWKAGEGGSGEGSL